MFLELKNISSHAYQYFPILICGYCCVLSLLFYMLEIKTYIGLCACIVGKHPTTETLSSCLLNFFIPTHPPPFLLVCFKKVAFKLTGLKQETFGTALKVLRSQGWIRYHDTMPVLTLAVSLM